MGDVKSFEDELRRMLSARVSDIDAELAGPQVRARAQARSRSTERFLPLVAAAAVLLIVLTVSYLSPGGTRPNDSVPPAGSGGHGPVATAPATRPPTLPKMPLSRPLTASPTAPSAVRPAAGPTEPPSTQPARATTTAPTSIDLSRGRGVPTPVH